VEWLERVGDLVGGDVAAVVGDLEDDVAGALLDADDDAIGRVRAVWGVTTNFKRQAVVTRA